MLTISNHYNKAVVYSDKIDKGAEGLLRALCGSPLAEGSQIRVMPDVHAGKGCVVGTTMTVGDYVAPGLVGADIGCGMLALQVGGRRLELQKLDKLILNKIPAGRHIRREMHRCTDRIDLAALKCARYIQQDKALRGIGTLGAGNHFIEVDVDEAGAYWLIIHSGSRHLGVEVAKHYQEAAFRRCPAGTPYELAYTGGALRRDYLHDMQIVQAYASLNRQVIASEILRGMKLDIFDEFDTVHNYIDLKHLILRKGACSAQAGERLLIPLNMRDGCLLCRGLGNAEWNFSAPHGAGRLLNRAEARHTFTVSQYKKAMEGIYSTSINSATLDESPMAYKPMAEIISQIAPTVEIMARLKPVYNFKAGEV